MKKILITFLFVVSLLFSSISNALETNNLYYSNKVEILKNKYKLKYNRTIINLSTKITDEKLELIISRVDNMLVSYSKVENISISQKENMFAMLYAIRDLFYKELSKRQNKEAQNIL